MRANGGRCYSVMRSSRFILVVERLADAIDTLRKSGDMSWSGRPIGNPRGQFSSSILFGLDGVCGRCRRKHFLPPLHNLCL
ncbi:unnamed protein product [Ectocarpus sp. 4 AP-2014]